MPEETTTDTANAQTTSDETAQNTGANDSGAATDTAAETQTNQETQKEKTFTQAEVDAIIQKRLKSAVKSELKKLTGETEGDAPNVEELQRQKQTSDERANAAEAKIEIRDYILEPKNKTGARVENIRAIEKLVLAEIEYDEGGKVSNLKEAIDRVKSEAPTLFTTATTLINGNKGKEQPQTVDFNSQIRQAAGFQG